MGGGFPPFSSRVEYGNGSIGRLGLRWRLGKLGGGARSVRNGHVQFSKVVMCFPPTDEAGEKPRLVSNFGYISRSK